MESNLNQKPATFSLALILILINAIIWIMLGVLMLTGISKGVSETAPMRRLMGALSISAGGFMLVLHRLLSKLNRRAYWLTIAAFSVTGIALFLDQFGWIDLMVWAINLAPVALLLISRKWYFSHAVTAINKPEGEPHV